MIGIKAQVLMERTLYLNLPDDTSKDKIIEEAKKEIILPVNALSAANNALLRCNIKISNLDLNDWETKSINYEII